MGSEGRIERALISVTDKTGIVEFAHALVENFGVEVISTGGTGASRRCTPRFTAACSRVAIPRSIWPRRKSTASR